MLKIRPISVLPKLVLSLFASVLAHTDPHLPNYSREVLSNGVVLDLIPSREVPMVTIRVLLKGGSESVPLDLAGLASVTSELIRKGTTTRSADQFAREVDSLGAAFSTGSDDQSTYISIDFLTKDLDSGLDLLIDAILHPSFSEPEVHKALARHVEASKALKDSPESVAYLYYRSLLFGPSHPYGRPSDELSYARITRRDIVKYHSRFYTGANMIVLVAGDFDTAVHGKKIASAFSAVPAGEPYAWKSFDVPPQAVRSLTLVDKPDATQTQIYAGVPGIARTDPDRVPLLLVNTVFGGQFTSLLNQQLRVDTGLTYGAYSFAVQSHLRGDLTISTFTQTDTTVETLDRILTLIQTLREKGLTPDQLAAAKRYVKGTYPADHLETPEQLASTIGELELYGLSAAEVNNYFARLDAITVEQANAVARKYFRDDQLRILLLGNTAKFRDKIGKYAPAVTEISINRPGVSVRP